MLRPTINLYRLTPVKLLVILLLVAHTYTAAKLDEINFDDRSERGTIHFLPQPWMNTEELLKQVRIPPEYAYAGDAPPQETTDLFVRLERWKTEVATRLRDLDSHLAASGSLSIEEQSLLVIYAAQYVGDDPWVSNNARSRAERTRLS